MSLTARADHARTGPPPWTAVAEPGERIGRRAAGLIVLSALLLAAAGAPIVLRDIPPLADYPNHLARLYAIGHLGNDPLLARFYRIEWHILPNLASDLLIPPLAQFIGLYHAGQVFLVLALALVASGAQAIHCALYRRLSPGPLAIFIFLYSYPLLSGVMNYVFGLGVALWGIAAWIRLREAPAPRRALVSTAFIAVLFLSHLYALGIYGLVLLCYEGWRAAAQRVRPPLSDLLAFALPFLPALPLLALTPTAHYAGAIRWDLATKLTGLAELVVEFHPRLDLALGFAIAALLLCAWWTRRVRLHPAGAVFAAATGLLFIAMPTSIFGSWGADVRLPISAMLVLVGFLDWRLPGAAARRGFLAAIVALSLFRIGLVDSAWTHFDASILAMRAAFSEIVPGSKILLAMADDHHTPFAMQKITQAPVLAMMDRSSFVPIAYTHPAMQILRVQPAFWRISNRGTNDDVPPPVSALRRALADPRGAADTYFADWSRDFDYLFVLYPRPGAANPMPRHLALLKSGPEFQLYRIRP